MPSNPVSLCVRKGDVEGLLVKCCRFSGGPVTREAIIALLIGTDYKVTIVQNDLQISKGRAVRKVVAGHWVVREKTGPKVMTDDKFRKTYLPMHHSVREV